MSTITTPTASAPTLANIDQAELSLRPLPRPASLVLLYRIARGLIALGILLRVARYLANRSLWLDEVLLARNILERSFAGLLQPLGLNQGAPVGFLMLQKLAVTFLGGSEYALRLLPLLAGVASVPLFWLLARRLLDLPIALFALALFVVNEPLIYYSSEAKQYGLDVTVALIILLAAARVLEHHHSARRLLMFLMVGVLAVWFSHPAVFVIAGAGSVLIASEWHAGRRAMALRFAILSLLCAISFAAHYLLFMHSLNDNDYLRRYWASAFMPWPPSTATLTWFPRTFWELFHDRSRAPVNLLLPEIAIFAFGLGAVALFLQRRKNLLFLAMPIILTLAAAIAHKYPFSDRLVLFITPIFLMVIAAGAGLVWQSLSHRRALIGGLLASALLLPSLLFAAKNVARPPGNEEARTVLAYLQKNYRPADTLYLYHSAKEPFNHYAPQLGLSAASPIIGTNNRTNWFGYISELERLRGRPRVWIVFVHDHKLDGIDEKKLFLMVLNRLGHQLQSIEVPGAAAYLYDLNTPANSAVSSESNPTVTVK